MLKDTTVILISRILALIFGVMITVIIARGLGPGDKGAFDLIILIVRTSVMVVVFGLGAANLFLGSREPEKLRLHVGNSIVASIIIGLSCFVFLELLFTLPQLQTYLTNNGIEISVIRWTVFIVPLLLMQTMLQEIIRATGNIVLYGFLSIFQLSIQLFFLLPLILSYIEISIIYVVVTWIISNVVMTLITLFYVLKFVHFQLSTDWQLFLESLKFGLKLHPGNITQFLNYRLDVFLVALFLIPEAVGFYTVAVMLAERLWEIPTSIRTALMYHVAAKPKSSLELTARTCRVIIWFTTPIYVLAGIFVFPIIRIVLGIDYLPSVPAFIYLLPGIWALSISRLLVVYLTGDGKPIVGTWSAFISLVFTVILDLLLIPSMGIVGAAIATSISYIVASLYIGFTFFSTTRVPLSNFFLIESDDLKMLKRIVAQRLKFLKQPKGSL